MLFTILTSHFISPSGSLYSSPVTPLSPPSPPPPPPHSPCLIPPASPSHSELPLSLFSFSLHFHVLITSLFLLFIQPLL